MSKILVVEDHESIREDIIDILDLNGFETLSAENGEEAYEIIINEMPDLVVSDIMMPGMDGYTLLQKIHENPTTSTIPFIYLTAKSGVTHIRTGMKIGVDDYITKPFLASDLIDAINTRLTRKKINDEKINRLCENVVKYVPHELRTLLVSILGHSQLLEESEESFSRAEIAEIAKNIKNSGKRLHERIEKFLILAGMELRYGKKSDSKILPCSEDSIHSTILSVLEEKQSQKDLEIALEPATLIISEPELKIVITELIENAVKFSKSGRRITVSCKNTSGFYQVEITDKGVGMTNEELSKIGIFEQFNREYFQQEGNGLGLAIVKKILENFNGRLNINSKKDNYTTVSIVLPVA